MNEKVNEMEYVYAAMLLHSAGKDIDDKAVGSVLKAAGVEADGARVKALVASLGSVDIDEAMATAVAAPVASAAPAASSGGAAAEAAPLRKRRLRSRGRGGRLRRSWLPVRLKQRLERINAKPLWARASRVSQCQWSGCWKFPSA